MGKAITIRDIAKEAKVSPTTVSRYLNGTGYVDEQTASRICEVVERFHYRPNRIAQSLKTKETKNLVLVVPDIQNPFYSKMANEMQRFLFEEGYTVTPVSYTHLGRYDVFVTKFGYIFPELKELGKSFIMSNTPGESYQMITEFDYKKIRRPIYPLDDI